MIIIAKFKDLTGQRFGKLTVIKRVENNDRNKVRWLCQCDCGNTHITISYNLNGKARNPTGFRRWDEWL